MRGEEATCIERKLAAQIAKVVTDLRRASNSQSRRFVCMLPLALSTDLIKSNL